MSSFFLPNRGLPKSSLGMSSVVTYVAPSMPGVIHHETQKTTVRAERALAVFSRIIFIPFSLTCSLKNAVIAHIVLPFQGKVRDLYMTAFFYTITAYETY